mgnify:FL=1
MATPQQKADAFGAAMGKLLLTDRALNGKISSDFLMANFTYSKDLQDDVAKVRKTDPASAAAMEAFFRDPAAGRAWLNKAAPQKTPVQQSAEQAAGAVADAVTPDWANGLVGTLVALRINRALGTPDE